jgi:hypothetical protein
MDCAIDAATAEKRRIGGVHNGVNVEPRDVPHDDFKHRTETGCAMPGISRKGAPVSRAGNTQALAGCL